MNYIINFFLDLLEQNEIMSLAESWTGLEK